MVCCALSNQCEIRFSQQHRRACLVMGVSPEELSRYYPRLYHMAHRGSWAGIQRHGLLCTESLLELCRLPPEHW